MVIIIFLKTITCSYLQHRH